MKRDKNRQKWITIRRDILADIIAGDPNRTWSVRELTAEMLKNEVIQNTQPDLTKSTVHRDWLAMQNSIHDKIAELADVYTTNQLDMLDDLTEELTSQLDDLKDIDVDEIEDPQARIAMQLKIANQIKALSDSILKIQKRQSSIVPNNAPKVLQVEETKTYTLDMFIEMRKELESGINPSIVRGALLATNPLNPLLVESPNRESSNIFSIPDDVILDGEIME